jgi:hypothetical protein
VTRNLFVFSKKRFFITVLFHKKYKGQCMSIGSPIDPLFWWTRRDPFALRSSQKPQEDEKKGPSQEGIFSESMLKKWSPFAFKNYQDPYERDSSGKISLTHRLSTLPFPSDATQLSCVKKVVEVVSEKGKSDPS